MNEPILQTALPPLRSHRARLVAHWFGLDQPPHPQPLAMKLDELLPRPGTITLITGPSGSGKSSLLRAVRRCATGGAMNRGRWIDLDSIVLPADLPLVDCFGEIALHDALSLLGRLGLAEAWTYVKTPDLLSDGQRWRLRLALGMHRAADAVGGSGKEGQEARPVVFCADEFAAVLDRITAMIVARALRRAVAGPLGAIVATSHDDLVEALGPELIVCCDFDRIRCFPSAARK